MFSLRRQKPIANDPPGQHIGWGGRARHHLRLFRTELSVELTDYLGKTTSWAHGADRRISDEFHLSSVDLTRGYIDDFRHGILEGARLKSDPTLTITDSIVNSPGAVRQSGTGNVQSATTSIGSAADVRIALKDFLESPEVAGLSEDDRQSLFDLSELMVGELKEISPEPTRLARFGKYC